MKPLKICCPRSNRARLALALAVLLGLIMSVADLFAAGESTSIGSNGNLPELPALPQDTAGLPSAGIVQLEEALADAQKAPDDAESAGNLGMALHANGFPQEAFRAYARAAILDREDWRWHYYSALALMDSRMTPKAEGPLRRTVALKPDFAPAWYWLGISLAQQGQSDPARQALREAAHASVFWELDQMARPGPRGQNPSLEFYAELAMAALANDAGQPREALGRLGRWLEKYPACADLHEEIARAYRLQQEEDKARKAEEFAWGAGCARLGQPADPLRDHLFRISQRPSKLLEGIYLASKNGNRDWAIYLARRAREIAPEDTEAAMQLGLLLVEDGEQAEGLGLLEIFRRNPEASALLLDQAGVVLVRHGLPAEAEKFFRASLKKDDAAATVYFHLASVLGAQDRWEDALAEATRGLELAPENIPMRLEFAQLLREAGKPERAIAQLEQVVEKAPSPARVYFQLGEIYLALQQYREAAENYMQALELDPEMEAASRGLRYAYERIPDQTPTGTPLTSLN